MTQFNKTLSTMAVCAAMMMVAQANAANDVTMQVTGNVIPAACTPSLTNSGEVSFGSISSSAIRHTDSGNGLVQLGSKNITLNVSCEAAAAVGFKMVDNRAGTVVPLSATSFIANPNAGGDNFIENYFAFGLGTTNGKNIGSYAVIADVSQVKKDGGDVELLFSENGGTSWRAGTNYVNQRPESARILSVGEKGSLAPAMFNELVMPLKVAVGIQPSSVLGFDEIVLDGSATMSLVYL